jgi:hypothetical protein
MKQQLIWLLLLTATVSYAHAQSEVYVCVDENGRKEYKNTEIAKGKKCKKVDLPGLTMIPAAHKKAVIQTASTSTSSKQTSSSADFPKIDSGTQKARDSERRQILLDEMKSEEEKLMNLKKEFNNGEPERRGDERNFAKYQERVASMKDDIGRTEKNIEALRREIGNLK